MSGTEVKIKQGTITLFSFGVYSTVPKEFTFS